MEETQRPCKRVVDSQTEQTYLMRPNYLNCYGNLFGGQLMGWIDEIASIVAMRHGIRKVINRAYVVMVAVDEHHHPIPVPGLIVESENDRAEWEGGEKRYRLRKQRRKEGF